MNNISNKFLQIKISRLKLSERVALAQLTIGSDRIDLDVLLTLLNKKLVSVNETTGKFYVPEQLIQALEAV